MPTLHAGDPAPDFTLESDTIGPVTLSELEGQTVVLYFYPKDDTPGCTVQACDFRDNLPRFDSIDVVILGVSADDVASHLAFRQKFDLNFPLLADVGGRVSELYGVWGERDVDGRKLMGILRSTFVIDPDGTIREAWYGVDPRGHLDRVAELLGA